MSRKALDAILSRERELRLEAVSLMPIGVSDEERMLFDRAEGYVVDGRFYFRVGDDKIRSMKIANL